MKVRTSVLAALALTAMWAMLGFPAWGAVSGLFLVAGFLVSRRGATVASRYEKPPQNGRAWSLKLDRRPGKRAGTKKVQARSRSTAKTTWWSAG